MTELAILDELAAEEAKAKTGAIAAYRAAVSNIAQGRPSPPAVKLIDILKSAGKTRDEFAAAIVLKKKRFELKATIEASRKLDKEREEIARQQDSALKAIADAIGQHEQTMTTINARANQLAQADASAQQATAQLHSTCDNEILIEQIANVEKRIFDLGHRIQPLLNDRENRQKALALIKEGNERLAVAKPDQRRDNYAMLGKDPNLAGDSRDGALELASGKRMLEDANEAERQLPALQKELAELEAEREGLFEQRLTA